VRRLPSVSTESPHNCPHSRHRRPGRIRSALYRRHASCESVQRRTPARRAPPTHSLGGPSLIDHLGHPIDAEFCHAPQTPCKARAMSAVEIQTSYSLPALRTALSKTEWALSYVRAVRRHGSPCARVKWGGAGSMARALPVEGSVIAPTALAPIHLCVFQVLNRRECYGVRSLVRSLTTRSASLMVIPGGRRLIRVSVLSVHSRHSPMRIPSLCGRGTELMMISSVLFRPANRRAKIALAAALD